MIYIIDSDILIYFFKNVPTIVNKFRATDPDQLATTIINYTELLFGAYNSSNVQKNLARIAPLFDTIPIYQFDRQAGAVFARLKFQLRKQGNLIADMDLMIAGICISNNFTLVTNNTKHFQRLDELHIENWAE